MMRFQFFLNPEAERQGISFKAPRTGDAGFDLPALEVCEIPAKSLGIVRTGVHVAIPEGWVGLVRDRSSMAMRGLTTVAGVIDASYRGEVKVAFQNLSDAPICFAVGDRIAQLVVVPHLVVEQFVQVSGLDELGATTRGSAGFGSTGN